MSEKDRDEEQTTGQKQEATGQVSDSPTEKSGLKRALDAYRYINREALKAAQWAITPPSLVARADQAMEGLRISDSFTSILKEQIRLSDAVKAVAPPAPTTFDELTASINKINGMADMLSDSIRPSLPFQELAKQMSAQPLFLTTKDLAFGDSLRGLTIANALDTSVARMLSGFGGQTNAMEALLQGWRGPIWEDLKQSSSLLEQIHSTFAASSILEIGSVERFNSVRLLKATCIYDEPDDAKDEAHVVELVRAEILDSVEQALDSVDSRLVKPWRGAKQTLKSDNPDRSRHLAVSLREMTTHLLHILAPDKAVKEWSTSSRDYHDGRPTRSARIKCIYSRYGSEIQAFFELDVKTAIHWIDLINKETHTLDGFETDEAMEALLARFEGLALSLIRGAKGFE